MIKVFIDGSHGTTGLKLREKLNNRKEIIILEIPEKVRKDKSARKEFINSSDITFLCLPDDGAREAVEIADFNKVRIIDASTAHRTCDGWVYGLPELDGEFREKIKSANKVAVPGCHASGFAAIVYPLIKHKVISSDYPLVCHSLTGYSGGGKGMIEEYKAKDRGKLLSYPRQYGLNQEHKHLKEMKHICSLSDFPLFNPIVADFYSGMEVTVPLYSKLCNGMNAQDVHNVLKEHYKNQKMIKVEEFSEGAERGFLSAGLMAERDDMKILVYGNEGRMVVSAVFDNLGKGASGAAIQCMNIMLGLKEDMGLKV